MTFSQLLRNSRFPLSMTLPCSMRSEAASAPVRKNLSPLMRMSGLFRIIILLLLPLEEKLPWTPPNCDKPEEEELLKRRFSMGGERGGREETELKLASKYANLDPCYSRPYTTLERKRKSSSRTL